MKGAIVNRITRLGVWKTWLLIGMLVFFLPLNVSAVLDPREVRVVANRAAWGSLDLAEYYMEKRGIPKENLIKLWITDKEWCSREEFEKEAVLPIRRHLGKKDPLRMTRCLVTMYGIPLKVSPPALTAEEKKTLESLKGAQSRLSKQLAEAKAQKSDAEKHIGKELDAVNKKIRKVQKSDHRSSFDSEIALVLKKDYPLSGWLPNPYFIGFKGKTLALKPDEVLLVSRLDGPTEAIVRRIIDDSMAAEAEGLEGIAYFDARWPKPDEEKAKKLKMGYGFYDFSIHRAAERVRNDGRMPVVVDDRAALFEPGTCPRAALYCGWYSLARYVDAFSWQKGAVGYHIASSECGTLRQNNSRVWCKNMLEKGAAATVGPVGEPYVQAFPVPELFFALLLEGRLSLAEVYAASVPFWSWQMVLVGDPLYRPFKQQ